jgi:hypothetical protein
MEFAAYGSLLALSEDVVSGVLSIFLGNAFLSTQVFHFSLLAFFSKANLITREYPNYSGLTL